MRAYLQGVVAVVVVVFALGSASAERRKNSLPDAAGASASCAAATTGLAGALALGIPSRTLLAQRCTQDAWSLDAKACFRASHSSTEATLCLDTLSKKQRIALEGDADRLADPTARRRLSQWLAGRSLTTPVTQVTLASYATRANVGADLADATDATGAFGAPVSDATVTQAALVDLGRARTLQKQAMTAYQHGNYELASKSFSAAVQASPTPDNIYFAAQSFRMKGSRARALELYERYLDVAPNGPAAPVCRYQIERLRDAIP